MNRYVVDIDLPSSLIVVEAENQEEAERIAYDKAIAALTKMLINKEIVTPCSVQAHPYDDDEDLEDLETEVYFG